MNVLLVTTSLQVLFALHVYGQARIPASVTAACYNANPCTGAEDTARSAMFITVDEELNHCCFDNDDPTMIRSNPGALYFRLDSGECRSCDHPSVINTGTVTCTLDCGTNGMGTATSADSSANNINNCCTGVNVNSGYIDGSTFAPTIACTRNCYSLITTSVGADPHFFLPLANGDHMCFSVQGEPDFAFSLINDKYIQLNGQFVLPAADESHTIGNVSTFLGDLGLVIKNKENNNITKIKVSALDHSVLVGNSLTIVRDKPVNVDVFKTISVTVDAHVQTTRLNDESAWLHINTDGFGIKVRFYKKHLDMFLTKTSGLTKDVHGMIGQFLTTEVKIDNVNMLMKLGDQKPISIKEGDAWPYLGIDEKCWYGTSTNNQGGGIIEGLYTDYIVEHLTSSKF